MGRRSPVTRASRGVHKLNHECGHAQNNEHYGQKDQPSGQSVEAVGKAEDLRLKLKIPRLTHRLADDQDQIPEFHLLSLKALHGRAELPSLGVRCGLRSCREVFVRSDQR